MKIPDLPPVINPYLDMIQQDIRTLVILRTPLPTTGKTDIEIFDDSSLLPALIGWGGEN